MGRGRGPKRLWAVKPDTVEPTGTDVYTSFPGSDYTPAEAEFLKAVERYQRANKKKFLSHVDYLRVAASLGYRRVEQPTEEVGHAPTRRDGDGRDQAGG